MNEAQKNRWRKEEIFLFVKPIGRAIRFQRKQRDLSQGELALLSGISREYISTIERGEAAKLSVFALHRIAKALNVSIFTLYPPPSYVPGPGTKT